MLLAEHYESISNSEEAEKVYFELVEITKNVFGVDHKMNLTYLVKLQAILFQKEDFEKAIEILLKMLKIQEKSQKNSLDYCKTLTHLSICFEKLGRKEEEKKYLLMNA